MIPAKSETMEEHTCVEKKIAIGSFVASSAWHGSCLSSQVLLMRERHHTQVKCPIETVVFAACKVGVVSSEDTKCDRPAHNLKKATNKSSTTT